MTASRSSDVVVVGGGVLGPCVAYALARRRVSVTSLDASTPGRAASAGGLWPLGESLGLECGVIFHATQGDGAVPEPLPRAFMQFLCASNRRFPVLAAELTAPTGVNIEAELGAGLLDLLYDEVQERHACRILEWPGDGRLPHGDRRRASLGRRRGGERRRRAAAGTDRVVPLGALPRGPGVTTPRSSGRRRRSGARRR